MRVAAVGAFMLLLAACGGGADAPPSLAATLREQHGWGAAQADCVATYVHRNLGDGAASTLAEGDIHDLPQLLRAPYLQLVLPCLAEADDG